jgi:hypothetical protein
MNQESMAPSELSDLESNDDSQNPPQNEISTTRRRAPSKREIMEELSSERFPWEE